MSVTKTQSVLILNQDINVSVNLASRNTIMEDNARVRVFVPFKWFLLL